MDQFGTDNNLSPSLQTTLAVGGALALVAGALIHHNRDKISSLLVENIAGEELNVGTDWNKLTIPAKVCASPIFSNVFNR